MFVNCQLQLILLGVEFILLTCKCNQTGYAGIPKVLEGSVKHTNKHTNKLTNKHTNKHTNKNIGMFVGNLEAFKNVFVDYLQLMSFIMVFSQGTGKKKVVR